jgi:hypothetical protein
MYYNVKLFGNAVMFSAHAMYEVGRYPCPIASLAGAFDGHLCLKVLQLLSA